MKRILILIIGLIGVAYGQSAPTSAKTRFVNGIYLGTKLDSYFNAADSNAIYWRADSSLMAKYKGTARALAFKGDLAPYKLISDTFFTGGYTTRWRAKQLVDSTKAPYDTVSIANRPVFIDQFFNNFYGRGMLTAETINLVTEQSILASALAGDDAIEVADTSDFAIGGTATIRHDNGLYYTYFVSAKGSSGGNGTIALKPSLLYPVSSSSKIERTWFNRAHPGKFYMRQLAQQIAKSTEISAAIPTGNRILYTNFSDTPALSKDTLTVVGSATINYFAASNNGVDTASPVRFPLGNTAYVEIAAANSGAETPLFYIDRPAQMIASVAMVFSGNVNSYQIQIINDSGRAIARYAIPSIFEGKNVPKIYKFPFISSLSNKIKVRIIADTFALAAAVSISQIDVFEQSAVNKDIIAKKRSTIVALGDSWVAGDTLSTLEREPITQQLAIELPYATIINKGVGGNTIVDMLNRFDTAVAPYNPDYVVIVDGTNDSYNPLSGTFYPNGVNAWIDTYNQLIHKVLSIGAKPIIVGVPALAQTDADVPSFSEWLLNDRARLYAQKFYRYLSKQTSEGGDYEWKLNTSDTATMLLAYPLTNGTRATGTWGINVTGNSATSTLAANSTTWNSQIYEAAQVTTPELVLMKETGGNWKYSDVGGLRAFIGLSSYVPYTGATAAVNLGSFGLTANSGTFNSGTFASGATIGSLGSSSDAVLSLATSASGSPRAIRYTTSTAKIDFLGTSGSSVFSVSNGGVAEAAISMNTPKLIGTSSTPSISGGSATYIGTGASTSVSGNDMAGEITLITGTGCSSTGASNRSALTVTFASAYSTTPIVQIQAIQQGGLSSTDGPSSNFFLRRDAVGTGSFIVYLPIGVTLTDSTTYLITYQVIGR